MQEPNKRNEKKDEKLQSDGEIHIPSLRDRHREREHGKIYKWFDNFWYHHKWKTLISLFLIVTVLVCTLQMCSREEKGDVSVVMAGPYTFINNEAGLISLRQCLALYLPRDYDENGAKQVDVISYMIYSKEQIQEAQKEKDEDGNPVRINTATISQNKKEYNTYMTLGASSVLFLDETLFKEMNENPNALVDLSQEFGTLPTGVYTDKDGVSYSTGVRLGDTAFYREHLAVSQVLPADTVLCLMRPFLLGESSEPEEYQKSVDFFAALIGVK